MHFTGMNGMPRRIYAYYGGMGWDFWNLVSTLGAFILAAGFVIFIYNMARSWRSGERASADPWDGRTLEWSIPSPPPEYNFAEIRTFRTGRLVGGEAATARATRGASRRRRLRSGRGTQHPPAAAVVLALLRLARHLHHRVRLVYLMNMNEAGVRTVNYVALTTAVIGVLIGMVSVYAWSFEPVNDRNRDGEHGAY